jgi:hypothetical protein
MKTRRIIGTEGNVIGNCRLSHLAHANSLPVEAHIAFCLISSGKLSSACVGWFHLLQGLSLFRIFRTFGAGLGCV